jgi:hypothetical protein
MSHFKIPCLASIDTFLNADYDFIVVGGGTAGLVVAARLMENVNMQVGVLDAGPAHLEDPMIMTPALYSQAIGNPEYDWLDRSTPQVCKANLALSSQSMATDRICRKRSKTKFTTCLVGKAWEDPVLSITRCTTAVRQWPMMTGQNWTTKAGASRTSSPTSKSMNISMILRGIRPRTTFHWKQPMISVSMEPMDLFTPVQHMEIASRTGVDCCKRKAREENGKSQRWLER